MKELTLPLSPRRRLTTAFAALILALSLGACHHDEHVTTDFGPEPWDQPEPPTGAVLGHISRDKRIVELGANSTLKINHRLALRSTETLESKAVHFQGGEARALGDVSALEPRCLLIARLTTDVQERVAQSSYHDGLGFDSSSGTFYLEPSAFPVDMSVIRLKKLKDGSGLLDVPIEDSRGILRGLRCHFSGAANEADLGDLSEIVGDALSFE